MNRKSRIRTLMTVAIFAWFGLGLVGVGGLGTIPLWGQADPTLGVSETAESLGLASQSRLNSGVIPVQLQRTSITPGQPFTMKSTMDNFVATGNTQKFGGLLGRYDTTNFGRLFSTQATTVGNGNTLVSLPEADDVAGDADRTGAARMYPPRIMIDPTEFLPTDLATTEVRMKIDQSVRSILQRHPLDPKSEQLMLVFQENQVVLRGRINSPRAAEALVLGLGLEPGVEGVINELEVLHPEEAATDDLLIGL